MASVALRYGGPSKACLEMARAQARLGNEVHIFTTNLDGPGTLPVPTDKAVQQEGVFIHYFPIQFPRFWRASLPLGYALKNKILEFDIVHIHSLYLFHTLCSAYYCNKYDVPYVLRPHGTLDPYIYKRHRLRKRIVEFLFQNEVTRRSSAIHYVTDEEMSLAKQYSFGRPGIVVPIGLNIDEYVNFTPSSRLLDRFPELAGKKIVLFLGRINFKKGLDILVPAFSSVAKKRDDVHLLIAGPDDESYGKQVALWLKNEGVFSKSTFTGMLHGEEKLEAFYRSSVFVLPSYSENFGISVLEAMACGLPVIISEKVNLKSTVIEADAGIVVPCDVKSFASSILKVIDDEEFGRRLGANGSRIVRERYLWEECAKRLIEEYNVILKSRLLD
jgi:glycosyltransferase involved in cell wall biosynthesis